MEKCVLLISSGMYNEPFYTEGMFSQKGTVRQYKWTEKHEKDKVASDFELTCDSGKGSVKVVRNGDVTSQMVFDASKRTKGSLNTVFGIIDVDIDTEYINFPSALSENLEFSYVMDAESSDPIKNTFSLKRLLQNDED